MYDYHIAVSVKTLAPFECECEYEYVSGEWRVMSDE